ncbi:MAG: hypothetical protein ACLP5H_01225 [Desulfomonilaceae bacterium]
MKRGIVLYVIEGREHLPEWPDEQQRLKSAKADCVCTALSEDDVHHDGRDLQSTKKEVLCEECGQPFIKYTYSRLSRCAACREIDGKPIPGKKE